MSEKDDTTTAEHRALVDELRRAAGAHAGMGALLRRALQAGSPCLPLVMAVREVFPISLMAAKDLSEVLRSESDERFDAYLLWHTDPARWPEPARQAYDPLGLCKAFQAGESVAALLRQGRAEGLGHRELLEVVRASFGLSQRTAEALVRRLGAASDAELDAALRDALAPAGPPG